MKIKNKLISGFAVIILFIGIGNAIIIRHLVETKKNIDIIELHLSQPGHGAEEIKNIKEIRKNILQNIRHGVMVFIIFSLSIIGLFYFIMKSVVNPITILTDAMIHLKQGSLDIQDIKWGKSNNEVGTLVVEFNKMSNNLRRTAVVLQDRTQELLKSNEKLEQELELREKVENALKQSLQDVQKERTLALELSKKAEAAGRIKSEFLANMSHEIRTPLNAVLGFSDVLKQTSLDEKQKDYLNDILVSGQLLLDLINNILDFSKIESGKVRIEEIDFDLEYLISNILKVIAVKLKESDVFLYADIDETIPRILKGDPTQLKQILVNLGSNAVKFTSKGEIGILVRKEEKKNSGEEIVLRFIVKDTGIGIEKEKQKIIFSSFSQADTSTTRKFGGTGLGLAICKSLVKAMRGNIWVESEQGKGSEFIFTVRLKESVPIAKKEIYPLSWKELKDKKVLIVEDNKKTCKKVNCYCTEIGMKVLWTLNSGQTALQKLKELNSQHKLPDMIICDTIMPEMDAYELVKKIRQNDTYKSIKTLAISSDLQVGVAHDSKENGFDGFLPKPIVKDEFQKVVATIFGDKRENGEIVTRHMAEELSCNGIRVLLAEDNIINQKLVQILLGNMGCETECAKNGVETIEKLKTNSYDICLMDLQMPEMGGIEATTIIRKEINKEIPIVALTAAATKEDKENCINAGMNDYLTKPIDKIKLKAAIFKYGRG